MVTDELPAFATKSEIDKGLAKSRVGIVLVTRALLRRLPAESIADKELSALLARERLIPVVHGMTYEDLREVSPYSPHEWPQHCRRHNGRHRGQTRRIGRPPDVAARSNIHARLARIAGRSAKPAQRHANLASPDCHAAKPGPTRARPRASGLRKQPDS